MSTNYEAKLDSERSPKEVEAEQNKVLRAKTHTKTDVRTSS
jgi:hypothetical protein